MKTRRMEQLEINISFTGNQYYWCNICKNYPQTEHCGKCQSECVKCYSAHYVTRGYGRRNESEAVLALEYRLEQKR
jgi:hypothetical protein